MDIRKWHKRYSVDCDLIYSSEATRRTYKAGVWKFLAHFKNEVEPKSIPNNLIKLWLLGATTHNTRKHLQCAINSFYRHTMGMPNKVSRIPYPKKQRSLPRVIESQVLRDRILSIKNLKHKAILAISYSCALRVSEVVGLKMDCIDRDRMLILIRNSKGRKDRYVKLSKSLLEILEKYYRKHGPTEYLFNGQRNLRYSTTSINKVVKKYLGPEYSTHTLRHSGITTMHENGTDIATLSKLAGHSSIRTTQIYTHVSNRSIQNIEAPI